MSLFLSYLIIPLVFLLLVINIIFRVKIIKAYKRLKNSRVQLDGGMLMKTDLIREKYKDYPQEDVDNLVQFTRSLRKLVLFAASGFIIILIVFLILYSQQA
ncbi:MAG: hypothetical protein HKN09_01450 [Saprospiraceae bacterium]|nr:hypothetical protein [Saprospiraceae bacterium]